MPPGPTLGMLLAEGTAALAAAGVDAAPQQARLLLAHVVDRRPNDLLLYRQVEADASAVAAYWQLVALRCERRPLEYVTGSTEFCGLPLRCDSRALIPRPETELLVEAMAAELAEVDLAEDARVVDVGCGSGAIALALAHLRPGLRLLATDVSAAALALTRENAARLGLGGRVEVALGAYLEPVFALGSAERVVAVVSNPPYVRPEEMARLAPEVLAEPHLALQSRSADGLGEYRELAQQAARLPHLRWLGVEVGYGQAAAVREILRPLGHLRTLSDYGGIERHVMVRVGG